MTYNIAPNTLTIIVKWISTHYGIQANDEANSLENEGTDSTQPRLALFTGTKHKRETTGKERHLTLPGWMENSRRTQWSALIEDKPQLPVS